MSTLPETPTRAQFSCDPVRGEFATPPRYEVDVELLGHPDARPVADEVATQVAAAYAYLERGDEEGKAAATALKSLGCVACELQGVCQVRSVLEEKKAVAKENQLLLQRLDMLGSAPRWLGVARLAQPNLSQETIRALKEIGAVSGDLGQVKQIIRKGHINLGQLLGGVTNEALAIFHKAELPELQSIPTVRPDVPIPAHTITTKDNGTFVVADATEAVGLTGHPPTNPNYAVLVSKLLSRLRERDERGRPQILNADGTMQKPIAQINGVPAFELRMKGKNRLYVAVDSSDPETPRITILGAHGGDAVTQEDFIHKSIRY